MQIYDALGRKQQLRKIEFIRTEGLVGGVEHVAFHIRGSSRGEIIEKIELNEKTAMEIMERLTEEFDYLGEPV